MREHGDDLAHDKSILVLVVSRRPRRRRAAAARLRPARRDASTARSRASSAASASPPVAALTMWAKISGEKRPSFFVELAELRVRTLLFKVIVGALPLEASDARPTHPAAVHALDVTRGPPPRLVRDPCDASRPLGHERLEGVHYRDAQRRGHGVRLDR